MAAAARLVGGGPGNNSSASGVATLTDPVVAGERLLLIVATGAGASNIAVTAVVDSDSNSWAEDMYWDSERNISVWKSTIVNPMAVADTVTFTLAAAIRYSRSILVALSDVSASAPILSPGVAKTFPTDQTWETGVVDAPPAGGIALAIGVLGGTGSHVPNSGWTELADTNEHNALAVLAKSVEGSEEDIEAGGVFGSSNSNNGRILIYSQYTSTIPVAAFTAKEELVDPPRTVEFRDISSDYPTEWDWDFGDGTSSTLRHPTHTYALPGEYTVSLTATNDQGSDTQEHTVFIGSAEGGGSESATRFIKLPSGDWVPIEGDDMGTMLFRTSLNFLVNGPVIIDTLPAAGVDKAENDSLTLHGIRAKLASGTSVTVDVRRNGVSILSGGAWVVEGGGTWENAPGIVATTFADNDEVDVVLTSPVGTPTDLSVRVVLSHAVSSS